MLSILWNEGRHHGLFSPDSPHPFCAIAILLLSSSLKQAEHYPL